MPIRMRQDVRLCDQCRQPWGQCTIHKTRVVGTMTPEQQNLALPTIVKTPVGTNLRWKKDVGEPSPCSHCGYLVCNLRPAWNEITKVPDHWTGGIKAYIRSDGEVAVYRKPDESHWSVGKYNRGRDRDTVIPSDMPARVDDNRSWSRAFQDLEEAIKAADESLPFDVNQAAAKYGQHLIA